MNFLIIGAGISGLNAANRLLDLGINSFQVLEARSQAGGRIQNLEGGFADVPLPLGSVTPFTDPDTTFQKVPFRPITVSECTVGQGCTAMDDVGDQDDFGFNYADGTLKDFLDQTFVSRLGSKLQLNTAVAKIDYTQSNKVVVTTNTGQQLEADRVLLATPPTTLQNRQIEFVPALPASYQQAADAIEVSIGIRAWFEFSQKWYPDFFTIDSIEGNFRDAVLDRGSSKNILTFQAIFEAGQTFQGQSDSQIQDTLLRALDGVFGEPVTTTLLNSKIQNWGNEAFINCALQGNADESGVLATPLDGRIFFTGEYVDGDFGEDVVSRLVGNEDDSTGDDTGGDDTGNDEDIPEDDEGEEDGDEFPDDEEGDENDIDEEDEMEEGDEVEDELEDGDFDEEFEDGESFDGEDEFTDIDEGADEEFEDGDIDIDEEDEFEDGDIDIDEEDGMEEGDEVEDELEDEVFDEEFEDGEYFDGEDHEFPEMDEWADEEFEDGDFGFRSSQAKADATEDTRLGESASSTLTVLWTVAVTIFLVVSSCGFAQS